MSISSMVDRWSRTVNIKIPTTDKADSYNQFAYTSSTVNGRLVMTEEEVLNVGDKIIAKAKLYTTENISMNSRIEEYEIISKKECRDKNNVIQFYKYFLK